MITFTEGSLTLLTLYTCFVHFVSHIRQHFHWPIPQTESNFNNEFCLVSFVGRAGLSSLWLFWALWPLRLWVGWLVSALYGGSRALLLHHSGGFMLHWTPGRQCLLCPWPRNVSVAISFSPSLSFTLFVPLPPWGLFDRLFSLTCINT